MFIHFNMATFNNRQWATGTEDPATFAPSKLDCGQWLDAAEAAGMKYAVLTVKHTGGWCLWDSKHTERTISRSFRNFRNGQGDLVREFVDACRKRGIKVGLYYCLPGDFAKRHLPNGRGGQAARTATGGAGALHRLHQVATERAADRLRADRPVVV